MLRRMWAETACRGSVIPITDGAQIQHLQPHVKKAGHREIFMWQISRFVCITMYFTTTRPIVMPLA
jgi:hypothetical protein